MTEIYIKNEDGEYVKPSANQLEEVFREKSDAIVSGRLKKIRDKETIKIREEIEAEVRKNATDSLRQEVKTELEKEYTSKLNKLETKAKEAENKAKQSETALRRKAIAAEYGFKPETEQFLGDGNDEEMRAKADTLKNSFQSEQTPANAPEKQTGPDLRQSFVRLNNED